MPRLEFVPLAKFDRKLWAEAHATVYDPALAAHMGVNPALYENPPSIEDFYRNFAQAYNDGKLRAWGILRDGSYIGHVLLDKSLGDWEVGAALRDPADWNGGVGVRATLHALRWAFEEDGSEWVTAFTQGKDPNVRSILLRGGFKPLMNFLVMSADTWRQRWASKRRNK